MSACSAAFTVRAHHEGCQGRGRRKSRDSGTAESVMPQREPIDDVKADVVDIDLTERLPEPVETNVTPWDGDVIGALPGQ